MEINGFGLRVTRCVDPFILGWPTARDVERGAPQAAPGDGLVERLSRVLSSLPRHHQEAKALKRQNPSPGHTTEAASLVQKKLDLVTLPTWT